MRRVSFILVLVACGGGGFTDPSRELALPVPEGTRYPVETHRPVTLGAADVVVDGEWVAVRCATCHGPTPDAAFANDPGVPDDFHGAIELRHGKLTCDFCHDLQDQTRLHLANGEPLELEASMTLCAQCHGVQHRDYQRGSHGGMNGYWDLRQGPRLRNHCVDCHDPHAPAWGQVLPVHPPRDRYLAVDGHEEKHP